MIHKQLNLPTNAQPGDAWVHPKGEFKRVLSRGGAWENVNLGSTHPDEVDHEQVTQPEAQLGDESAEVPSGAGESASGNGDDGQAVSESGRVGEENTGVNEPAGHETNDDVSGSGEPLTSTGPIEGDSDGGGIDSDPDRVV
jgi:hypothetical protein